MKISHKKAFKFYIRSQRGQLDSKSEIRLSNHLETCGDCQHLISVENKVSQTKNWMNTGKSLDRESKTINAVQRDARRYLMFSRLSKNTKIFALSALLVLIMSSIILTKDNLLPVPAALQETQIVKEDEGEKLIVGEFFPHLPREAFDYTEYYEMINELIQIQEDYDFELMLPSFAPSVYDHQSFDLDPKNGYFKTNYVRQINNYGYTGGAFFLQQRIDPTKELKALTKEIFLLTNDADAYMVPIQVSGNDGLFFRGAIKDDEFYPYEYQWQIAWMEEDIFYTLSVFGSVGISPDYQFPNNLIINAEYLSPISDFDISRTIPPDPESYVTSGERYRNLINRIPEIQTEFDFELKFPTYLPHRWGFHNSLTFAYDKSISLQFRPEEGGNGINDTLVYVQKQIDPNLTFEKIMLYQLRIYSEIELPWIEININGNQAFFLRGMAKETGFDEYENIWELSWLENDILYRIILSGDHYLYPGELILFAESFLPFKQQTANLILDQNVESNPEMMVALIQAQEEIRFDIKIPTNLTVGWDFISSYSYLETQYFRTSYQKAGEQLGSVNGLSISQQQVDPSNGLIPLLNDVAHYTGVFDDLWKPAKVNGNQALYYQGNFINGDFDTDFNRWEIAWLEENILYTIIYHGGDEISYPFLVKIGEGLKSIDN